MGYFADGNGSIVFARPVTETEERTLEKLLNDEGFESGFYCGVRSKLGNYDPRCRYLGFCTSDKYHGDNVRDMLDEIAKLVPIKSGELTYVGEDYCYWRFIYKDDGRWHCQDGYIVYNEDY